MKPTSAMHEVARILLECELRRVPILEIDESSKKQIRKRTDDKTKPRPRQDVESKRERVEETHEQ